MNYNLQYINPFTGRKVTHLEVSEILIREDENGKSYYTGYNQEVEILKLTAITPAATAAKLAHCERYGCE